MTPSSGSYEIHDAPAASLLLDLPEGEGFRSLPPQVSLARFIERNQ